VNHQLADQLLDGLAFFLRLAGASWTPLTNSFGALALRFDHPSGSWLAALYVDDAARGKGWPQVISIHLWSACRDFYERYGWQYIGDGLEYPNTRVHLYRYSLCASAGDATE
jgi:GNAT superfamily N-acetyltransferase